MLHTAWNPSKRCILAFGLFALSLVGIFLSLTETRDKITRMVSHKEHTTIEYVDRSYEIMDKMTGKIPSDAELKNLTESQLDDLYWSYINTVQVLCRRIVRVGKIEDGGKEVCTDEAFHPRPPCLVYSFGINFQWDFDEDAARMFGCKVFSFDPRWVCMKNYETFTR
ncbi:hypothetical protein CHS0354_042681 [Potamilus streckersoni]|uniref:Methyltransferase domain-containing protein n=1 Tax=Potamilus streckersoni TaxID=2493646 RepID=A0AAE0S9C6_9BIVA|nr:hypothetical protein CHS0354_042681 [Potamilus streckersoni]